LAFVECWTASFSAGAFGNCFVITGDVDGVQIVGHRFLNNSVGNGLYVSGASVKHVYVDASVAAGITSGTGFLFINGTTDFAVRNCHSGIYGGMPGNLCGIQVASGCSRYLISGCILESNTTNLVDSGATPKTVGPNLSM
jgi:hypothetical protein